MVFHLPRYLPKDGRSTPQSRGGRSLARTLAVERLEDRTLLSSFGATTEALHAAYGHLPLAFEANQGQAPAPTNFVARGAGYSLSLMPTEAVLGLQKLASTPTAEATASPGEVVQLQLVSANRAALAVGLDELMTKSNYFPGDDPSQWRTNVPNFSKVEYQNVYLGVNLVYYGNQGQLEYDFVVAPGADPGAISLSVQGTQGMTLDGQGNLVVQTGGGDVVEQAPVLYQDSAGVHQAISGRFVLEGKNQVGFQVGAYDPSRALIIDPVLSYSTYLGGSGDDYASAITVDTSGDAYVTGFTSSTNFPTASAFQTTLQGSRDAFITKLNATGTTLVYSTYLGGSLTSSGTPSSTDGYGIAVDSAGNAYVTGSTNSSNFPTTPGAFQTTCGGGSQKAFVAKFSAAGSLVYSTYLGGSGADGPTLDYFPSSAIAVDSFGNAYVEGPTSSTNFPTTSNAYQPTLVGTSAGYITEVNPTGTGLVYSTYLTGGPGSGIALNAGEIYVTGGTSSTNLPATSGAYQRKLSGSGDAFVAVLNPSASIPSAQMVYATYLGPSSSGSSIAVDSSGNAYVTGYTGKGFPTTAGAFQTQYPRGALHVAFVAKINPSGSGNASLIYSTYLGGKNSVTGADGIAVDNSGNAYVTGPTDVNLPTTANALQPSFGNAFVAAFVTTLNPSGSALLFSTYLGGTGKQNKTVSRGIALDGSGNIYVTGFVNVFNGYPLSFPVNSGAFQTTYDGANDAFLAKISTVVSAAAAPSANLEKELPLEFAANLLSLTSIAESTDLPPAAAGAGAPRVRVIAPVVGFSQPLGPLTPGAAAGTTALSQSLRQESWPDRVFAEFDHRPLEYGLLGEMALA